VASEGSSIWRYELSAGPGIDFDRDWSERAANPFGRLLRPGPDRDLDRKPLVTVVLTKAGDVQLLVSVVEPLFDLIDPKVDLELGVAASPNLQPIRVRDSAPKGMTMLVQVCGRQEHDTHRLPCPLHPTELVRMLAAVLLRRHQRRLKAALFKHLRRHIVHAVNLRLDRRPDPLHAMAVRGCPCVPVDLRIARSTRRECRSVRRVIP
jgi:hypothetical protein